MAAKKRSSAWKAERSDIDIDMDYKPEGAVESKNSGLFLKIAFIALFVVMAVVQVISNNADPTNPNNMSVAQLALMGLFALIFSSLCEVLAKRIGRNTNFAWALGFLFGLFGLFVYSVYYLIIAFRQKAQKGVKKAAAKPSVAKKRIVAKKKSRK